MSLSTPAAPTRAIAAARVRRFGLAILAAAAVVIMLPASAFAVQARSENATFDGSDTTAGAFTGLGRLAVDQGAGTVYALDAGAGVVDKFDASGAAQDFSAPASSSLDGNAVTPPDGPVTFGFFGESDVAVDNSGTASDGNLVAVAEFQGTAWVFDSTGAYLHQLTGFGDPCGAAVDSAGDVWISDFASSTVSEFTAAGVATGTTVDTSSQGSPCHIAFDSNDDLYVALYFGAVRKYTAASGYTASSRLTLSPANAVAVDRDNHRVYLAHSDKVSVYDQAGAHLYDFADSIAGSLTGVAINQATDEVYVSDSTGNTVHVFGAPGPDVVTGTASDVSPTAATLEGTVDPQGVAVSDCHFEYGTDTSYGQTAPCVETVGSGSGAVSVHADVSGLDPLRTYHFRLVATNANDTSNGADATLFTATAPQIVSQSVSDVLETEATLRAQLNPGGAATTYHFDYGTTASYGQSTAQSASIGSDATAHPVSATLTGLTPATTYHYRVVATNTQGDTNGPDKTFTTFTTPDTTPQSCPNAEFRTGHGATLPDCRAYERATPINKNGNNPQGGVDDVEAADDGRAITYYVGGGMPGGDGSQDFPMYIARRGGAAWSSAGIYPPASYGERGRTLGWTRDQSSIFDLAGTRTSTGSSVNALLARDGTDGSIETVVPFGTFDTVDYVGASRDGSKVYFEAFGQLTANAASGFGNLFVADRATGVVSLAGVLPDGSTPAGGSFMGSYGRGGNVFNHAQQGYTQDNHAVSDDGSTVFFTTAGIGQLYARKDATGPGASTAHVSASRKTNGAGPGGSDPNGPQPAMFRAATPDASKVLFTSPEELTDDATTGAADEGNDLYVYDIASDQLTDLTPDAGDANGADVQGVIGISDDASYVYFAANGVLADGATPGDCDGEDPTNLVGVCNLYLWHDGDIGFVAQLDARYDFSGSDATNWQVGSAFSNGNPTVSTGRVTPDGRTLLFSSKRRLTDYDNSSGCEGGFGEGNTAACVQLYRYRVGASGVTCVSCNPSGAAPTGPAAVQSMAAGPGSPRLPAATRTRNLSPGGDRVFFDTVDSLLPGDTNGVRDVYMWQAEGSGSCHSSSANGGCIYLLSSGRSSYPSFFADASASGDDVFFFTDSQLVPGDRDGNVDVYDARVGGGLAVQHAVDQAPCSGEACRAPLTAPVAPPTAGSVSFSGDGNQDAPAKTSVSVSRLRVVTGSVAKLRIRVPRAGRIAVTGASLRTARRSVARGATYTLTVRLSAKAKLALKRSSKLKVRARVAFTPRTGAPVRRALTLSFKQSKHAGKAAVPPPVRSKGGH